MPASSDAITPNLTFVRTLIPTAANTARWSGALIGGRPTYVDDSMTGAGLPSAASRTPGGLSWLKIILNNGYSAAFVGDSNLLVHATGVPYDAAEDAAGLIA